MRLQKRIVVETGIAGEDRLGIAADVYWPTALRDRPRVLFCQPGGALGKGYFNLELEDGDNLFNFAAQMTAHGCIVIALDHLGTGASDRPRDGFALTPAVLTAAMANAVAGLCAQLRDGSLDPALPALPEFIAVGVGHSMGAMLTAIQQARHASFAAVALFGFGTRGLPDYLSARARAYIDDAAGAQAHIVELAREKGDDPYPELVITAGNARSVYGGGADRRAVAALAHARTNLLAVPGLFSVIPGSTEPDCARIDVPVFLAVGDRDMTGASHSIPASFSGSSEVNLLVLPETGHSHFLFASCSLLCARLAHWVDGLGG